MPDLSPAITVFLSVLTAVLGLYVLRIPQAARILAQAFTRLNAAQEKRAEAQEKRIGLLEKMHAECEERADDLEDRLRKIERSKR